MVRKLASIAALNDAEREAIRALPMVVKELPARCDIVREGDRPMACCVILSGFAFRYKMVAEGRRQILAFHVPGDLPDLQSLHLSVLDHHLAALTPTLVGLIPHDAMHELNARFPRVAGALWRQTLIDSAIFRAWIVGLGQRDALSRTAHLLCEIMVRMQAVGLAEGASMELPITQVDLADALGMSTVHINRTFRELRTRKLITLNGRSLVLNDWDALRRIGDFDPAYLHLAPRDRPTPP